MTPVKVCDAGVLVDALIDRTARGSRARAAMQTHHLAAPHLVDIEVVASLRRLVRLGRLPTERAEVALTRLVRLPLDRHDHPRLLDRCWRMRENVTPYDAAYLALAEALGVPLLTADARLAKAPGLRCEVELLEP